MKNGVFREWYYENGCTYIELEASGDHGRMEHIILVRSCCFFLGCTLHGTIQEEFESS